MKLQNKSHERSFQFWQSLSCGRIFSLENRLSKIANTMARNCFFSIDWKITSITLALSNFVGVCNKKRNKLIFSSFVFFFLAIFLLSTSEFPYRSPECILQIDIGSLPNTKIRPELRVVQVHICKTSEVLGGEKFISSKKGRKEETARDSAKRG